MQMIENNCRILGLYFIVFYDIFYLLTYSLSANNTDIGLNKCLIYNVFVV